jgi:benzoyl-CoA reductase/2-hydroxyglutaryl-CoA dehydratase subunit BcrC/BadD/HgdB
MSEDYRSMWADLGLDLAANATLVGLCSGADFATEDVEKLLPRNTCALIKSSSGFKIGKVCPYLESADMIVGENTCDGKKKAYESLNDLVENLYVMDLPQVKSENGKALLRSEYKRFKEAVEKLTGVSITAESLKEAIHTVNAKRAAVTGPPVEPPSCLQGTWRRHCAAWRFRLMKTSSSVWTGPTTPVCIEYRMTWR